MTYCFSLIINMSFKHRQWENCNNLNYESFRPPLHHSTCFIFVLSVITGCSYWTLALWAGPFAEYSIVIWFNPQNNQKFPFADKETEVHQCCTLPNVIKLTWLGEQWPPKVLIPGNCVLIPGTCEYVARGNLADMIKLRVWDGGDYSASPGGAQCNHRGPYE